MHTHNMIYIAMADDHKLVREAIAAYLQQADERLKVIIQAGDGIELMELTACSAIRPDVCLTDISMPRMDGYETLLQLKKQYPGIRCLALTIFNQSDHAILQMLHNGAYGFVTKNCSTHELVQAIRTVHAGNYYFCRDVLKIFPRLSENTIDEHKKNLLSAQDVVLLAWSRTTLTSKEIAKQMYVSERTVENGYHRLHEKLNIKTKQGLAMYAAQAGIVAHNMQEEPGPPPPAAGVDNVACLLPEMGLYR